MSSKNHKKAGASPEVGAPVAVASQEVTMSIQDRDPVYRLGSPAIVPNSTETSRNQIEGALVTIEPISDARASHPVGGTW